MTRVVFMGSPEFAVPILRALAVKHSVVGVVTQPDRPAGRGREVKPPEIKRTAMGLGIETIQPEKIAAAPAMERIRAWAPDLIVVAAFGQILRSELLHFPLHGCVNVHASLLPRWRGAAPIQAAIAAGDAETGVTIMVMDEGLDTGGILSQKSLPIESDDTGGSLAQELADLGASLLSEMLPPYLSGALRAQAQDESRATKAPRLNKQDGLLDFADTASNLARRVRAFDPWPGAYLTWTTDRLKVLRAHAEPGTAEAGRRIVVQDKAAVGTADGILVLDEVQPAGKKAMESQVFLLGARAWTS
jgi:methionyl-tRNA formyltransferase